jgi:hypothetical protein
MLKMQIIARYIYARVNNFINIHQEDFKTNEARQRLTEGMADIVLMSQETYKNRELNKEVEKEIDEAIEYIAEGIRLVKGNPGNLKMLNKALVTEYIEGEINNFLIQHPQFEKGRPLQDLLREQDYLTEFMEKFYGDIAFDDKHSAILEAVVKAYLWHLLQERIIIYVKESDDAETEPEKNEPNEEDMRNDNRTIEGSRADIAEIHQVYVRIKP